MKVCGTCQGKKIIDACWCKTCFGSGRSQEREPVEVASIAPGRVRITAKEALQIAESQYRQLAYDLGAEVLVEKNVFIEKRQRSLVRRGADEVDLGYLSPGF